MVYRLLTVGLSVVAFACGGEPEPGGEESRPSIAQFFDSTAAWFDVDSSDVDPPRVLLRHLLATRGSTGPDGSAIRADASIELTPADAQALQRALDADGRDLVGIDWADDGSGLLRTVVALLPDGTIDFPHAEADSVERTLDSFAESRGVDPATLLLEVATRPRTQLARDFLEGPAGHEGV